jgi:hypothetical protein
MPFTVTHCVAAIPLAHLFRWRLPFLALLVGCMVNDLGVFFYDWVDYYAMHSSRGLISHCLPIGWLVYLFYHWILKFPLQRLMPLWLATRLWEFTTRPLQWSVGMLVSTSLALVLGAASHLFWDSFTHSGWWGVETFPALDRVIYDFPERPIHWFSILQHGSSVVCLPILALYLAHHLRRIQPVSPAVVPTYRWGTKLLAAFVLLTVPVCAWLYLIIAYPGTPQYRIIHEAVKLAGTILIVITAGYGMLATAFIGAGRPDVSSSPDTDSDG